MLVCRVLRGVGQPDTSSRLLEFFYCPPHPSSNGAIQKLADRSLSRPSGRRPLQPAASWLSPTPVRVTSRLSVNSLRTSVVCAPRLTKPVRCTGRLCAPRLFGLPAWAALRWPRHPAARPGSPPALILIPGFDHRAVAPSSRLGRRTPRKRRAIGRFNDEFCSAGAGRPGDYGTTGGRDRTPRRCWTQRRPPLRHVSSGK